MDDFFARRGLSIDRLRSFLAVADAGSIARAAPGNQSRQTQLSRQIGDLEEFYERALFEPRGKGIVLTSAGHELAIVVRETLARLKDVGTKTTYHPVDVTLGAGDSVIRWWIIPRYHAFGRARLQVLMCSGPEVVEGLLDAKLDFGIVRASDLRLDLRSGLRSRTIGTIDYALYVPKELVAKARTLSVKEMLQLLPIGVLTGEPGFSARLDAALVRANVRLTPAFVCETFPQLQAAVAAGVCAAVLPTLVRDHLPPAKFNEHRDPILGKHDGRMCLAWTTRLERQRPRVAALMPGIVQGMQR
jgi:DNA-binding transcriptional LysR family regulator